MARHSVNLRRATVITYPPADVGASLLHKPEHPLQNLNRIRRHVAPPCLTLGDAALHHPRRVPLSVDVDEQDLPPREGQPSRQITRGRLADPYLHICDRDLSRAVLHFPSRLP